MFWSSKSVLKIQNVTKITKNHLPTPKIPSITRGSLGQLPEEPTGQYGGGIQRTCMCAGFTEHVFWAVEHDHVERSHSETEYLENTYSERLNKRPPPGVAQGGAFYYDVNNVQNM